MEAAAGALLPSQGTVGQALIENHVRGLIVIVHGAGGFLIPGRGQLQVMQGGLLIPQGTLRQAQIIMDVVILGALQLALSQVVRECQRPFQQRLCPGRVTGLQGLIAPQLRAAPRRTGWSPCLRHLPRDGSDAPESAPEPLRTALSGSAACSIPHRGHPGGRLFPGAHPGRPGAVRHCCPACGTADPAPGVPGRRSRPGQKPSPCTGGPVPSPHAC